jgi:hypothetical protein
MLQLQLPWLVRKKGRAKGMRNGTNTAPVLNLDLNPGLSVSHLSPIAHYSTILCSFLNIFIHVA